VKRVLVTLVLAACSSRGAPPVGSASGSGPAAGPTAYLEGKPVALTVANGLISAVAPATAATAYLSPPIVDSHVHVTYWDIADKLPATGIAAVVDLAAPERALGKRPSNGLTVIQSGPMLTRPGGYPLESWGSDGYGVACSTEDCVVAEVGKLHRLGARVVKVAFDGNGLARDLLPAAVKAAHAQKLKVVVHALGDDSARAAAAAGADVLGHTPVEPLGPETVAAWKGRAVISSLAAFGGSEPAVANLRALRQAGATVLYGTDMGNLRDDGPSGKEIDLLKEAGLDDAAIHAAMTTTPAAYWELPFGVLAAERDASFLVLDRDPAKDARALLAPREVWLHGLRIR
jgi:imidazolonepropionase-like amidohydrolase